MSTFQNKNSLKEQLRPKFPKKLRTLRFGQNVLVIIKKKRVEEKDNRQRLIFRKYNTWLKISVVYSLSTRRANRLAGSLACEGRVTLLPGKTFCHVYNLARLPGSTRSNVDSQSIRERNL